jgi:hypothetical protein
LSDLKGRENGGSGTEKIGLAKSVAQVFVRKSVKCFAKLDCNDPGDGLSARGRDTIGGAG